MKASAGSVAAPSPMYGQGTTNPLPACAAGDYDPEWWVHEHIGHCGKGCSHGLAVHICLTHCPLLRECQGVAATNPRAWPGMVMGGIIWSDHLGRPRSDLVVAPWPSCSSCRSN